MIYRKLIVLASLLIGFVNIAFAGVGDLDTLNVRSQAPVKERMPVVAYKFNPKSLILPASLITVGAVGTAIDGMNDFHLFSRKDSVKQIHIDNYLEWGMLGWVVSCLRPYGNREAYLGGPTLLGRFSGRDERIDGAWAEELGKRASPGRGALFVSVRTYLECFLRGAYGL